MARAAAALPGAALLALLLAPSAPAGAVRVAEICFDPGPPPSNYECEPPTSPPTTRPAPPPTQPPPTPAPTAPPPTFPPPTAAAPVATRVPPTTAPATFPVVPAPAAAPTTLSPTTAPRTTTTTTAPIPSTTALDLSGAVLAAEPTDFGGATGLVQLLGAVVLGAVLVGIGWFVLGVLGRR